MGRCHLKLLGAAIAALMLLALPSVASAAPYKNLLGIDIAGLPSVPTQVTNRANALGSGSSATAGDQNSNTDAQTWANALVYAKNGTTTNRDRVCKALASVIGSETPIPSGTDRTLGIDRSVPAYVLAADLIGVKPDGSGTCGTTGSDFSAWLTQLRNRDLGGLTWVSTHEVRPNNFGTWAGAGLIVADLWQGNAANFDRDYSVWRDWVGGPDSAFDRFSWGDLSWQADPAHPRGINPAGATKTIDGASRDINGVFPDDQRRQSDQKGCPDISWPPCSPTYPWGVLQSQTITVRALDVAGYNASAEQSSALKRAALWQDDTPHKEDSTGYHATGDDGWVPYVLNGMYGISSIKQSGDSSNGESIGDGSYWGSHLKPVGGSDTTAPSTPTGLASSSVTATSFTLTWSASTDNVGVTGYQVFKDGTLYASPSGTSQSVTGLSCGTTYAMTVKAVDAASNASGASTALKVTTAACTDTTAPGAPTGLTLTNVTGTGATLSWTASTDNVAVSGYDVTLNGTVVGSPSGTSFDFTGLLCGTSYTVGTQARDAAGNRSTRSTTTLNTSACPADTTSPSSPGTVTTSSVTQTSFTVSWGAATDNVGVDHYEVSRDGVRVASPTTTSTSMTGLVCGTSYALSVVAVDAAGNKSVTPATASGTTGACSTSSPEQTLAPAADTFVDSLNPTTTHGADALLGIQNGGASGVDMHAWLKYTVPAGLRVGSAKLRLNFTAARSANGFTVKSSPTCPTSVSGLTYNTEPSRAAFVGSDSKALIASGDNEVQISGANLTTLTNAVGSDVCFVIYSNSDNTTRADFNSLASATHKPQLVIIPTVSGADSTPPSTPTNLAVTASTDTSVSLHWSPATDNVGVDHYVVAKNGTQVAAPASSSTTVSSLQCGTTYTFGVYAVDAAGNASGTAKLDGTTAGCAPTAPTVFNTYTAAADTFVEQANPTMTHGGDLNLTINDSTTAEKHAWIKYTIPANSPTPLTATLKLYATSADASSGLKIMTPDTCPTSVSALTWNNEPNRANFVGSDNLTSLSAGYNDIPLTGENFQNVKLGSGNAAATDICFVIKRVGGTSRDVVSKDDSTKQTKLVVGSP